MTRENKTTIPVPGFASEPREAKLLPRGNQRVIYLPELWRNVTIVDQTEDLAAAENEAAAKKAAYKKAQLDKQTKAKAEAERKAKPPKTKKRPRRSA